MPRPFAPTWWPSLAALSLVTAAFPARAQTPSEIAAARQWFADGLAREEKTDWAGALDLFRRAAQVKRTPQIVYHVGLCESRTGALVEALVDLDGATGLARAAHNDDVVTAAQAELAEVKKRIPTLDIRVPGGAAPARLVVDGHPMALSMLHTPMPIDPGEHAVSVDLASGATATGKATLAEHEARQLDLAVSTPAPASTPLTATSTPTSTSTTTSTPTPTPTSPGTPPPPESPSSQGSALPLVLLVAGGAVTVGGVVLFADARSKASSLDSACPSHTGCNPSLESTYSTGRTLNTLGLVLGGVGLAGVAVGASLLAIRPSPSSSSALVVGPGRLAWTMAF